MTVSIFRVYPLLMPSRAEHITVAKIVQMGRTCAGFNLRKTTRVVTQLYEEALRPLGMRSTQFMLLAAIKGQEPVTVQRLATTVMMDRTTVTRDLKPLEKQGLVRVEPGEDRRERRVSLTMQGDKALVAALPRLEALEARIIKTVGKERVARLLADLAAATALIRPS
ncbi:MAG: MarR family winged helix-turn-helix transcriptional regulator [Candidatus Binatia bacterium]